MNKIVSYFKNLEIKEATKFLIIFYIVGTTGFLIPKTRGIFEMLIPLSLLINLFMLFLFHSPFNKKHLLFFVAVVAFSFGIEAIGVKTGILFGEYIYGSSLSVKIFQTPILIGFNWLMLTYGVVQLLRQNSFTRKYLILIGSVIMTAYDFVMEPVAMKTDMWSWSFNQIPLQNYIMWFIISSIILAGFEIFAIKTNNKIAGRIFLFQLLFFLILHLFLP